MTRLVKPLIAATFCGVLLLLFHDAPGQNTPGEPLRAARPSLRASDRATDPIAYSAYGSLFDAHGRRIAPTPEFLRTVQGVYLQRLLGSADAQTRERFNQLNAELTRELRSDEMAVRFLLIEWLNEAVAPTDRAFLYAKNRTMRMAWYKIILGEERFWEVADKVSGLPRDIAEVGLRYGILRRATTATGSDYMRECEAAGVPIPPTWGEEGPGRWNHVGDLTTNFVGSGNPARVYRYDSRQPEGICVALPRINGSIIDLLGIICLGRQSGNACFYDNERVNVGDRVPIDRFKSGGNLSDVCSDCHAGENPFVVHGRNPPLDMAPDNRSPRWHTPLVRPDWPQNPGPSPLLGQVTINQLPPSNDASCLTCHNQGDAGRFPDILELNRIAQGAGKSRSGYCGTVLLKAMGNTMPGGVPYQKHVDAMRAFCEQSVPPGGEVPPPAVDPDPRFVSPPIVIGPLYACAEGVEVRGAVRNGRLTVRINGIGLPSVVVATPSSTMVQTAPLVAGDVVDAFQEVDGVVSGISPSATVIDHTIAYPSGLPAPRIDPTRIHECGRIIAVRHVRGASVTVLTNGGSPATYSVAGDWTNLQPLIRPFNLNDRYIARQQLCTSISPESGAETAVLPPTPMPVPTIDPTPPLAGQELLALRNLPNGALTTVIEAGAGTVAEFSTAVDWHPEVDIGTRLGRPLQAGDRLTVTAELCTATRVSVPETQRCQSLPAPVVAQPFVGDVQLTVLSAAPGARVQVYDAGLREIGDGSGSMIGLSRAVVQGDVLTIMQRLGNCASGSAYQVTAVCASTEACRF